MLTLANQNEILLCGAEDGTVCMYSLETGQYDKILTRSTLPIRDIAISPDGKWAAIASELVFPCRYIQWGRSTDCGALVSSQSRSSTLKTC